MGKNAYAQGLIKVEDLDKVMQSVLNSGSGVIGMVLAAIKLFVIFAWWYVRRDIIAKQIEADRQENQQNQHNQAQAEVNT